ncbi:MAG: hypothetical protein VX737_02455 [Pseudomonadota bacterium]|nr:hypothetical protein [Pseudomonadota bacterium]
MENKSIEAITEKLKGNLRLVTGLIWSFIPIAFPQISPLQLLAWSVFCYYANDFTKTKILNIKEEKTNPDNLNDATSFIMSLTRATKKMPQAVAITCLICLLSTLAPVTLYFSLALNNALSGASITAFKYAAYSYVTYILAQYFLRDIVAKGTSIRFGTLQGNHILELTRKNRTSEKLGELLNSNEIEETLPIIIKLYNNNPSELLNSEDEGQRRKIIHTKLNEILQNQPESAPAIKKYLSINNDDTSILNDQGGITEKLDQILSTLKQFNDLSAEDQNYLATSGKTIDQIRDITKMTTSWWYYRQTLCSSVISMASSLYGVILFPMPVAYQFAKRLLLVRTAFIAIFLNLAALNISKFLGEPASKKTQEERGDIAKNIKSGQSNPAFLNALLRESVYVRFAIDGIYNLPKRLLDNNLMPLMLIIVMLEPAFPLVTITAMECMALASALKVMINEFSNISRNSNAQIEANSRFETIIGKGVYTKTSVMRIISDLNRSDRKSIKSNFYSRMTNVADSAMFILTVLSSMSLASLYFPSIAITGLTLPLFVATSMLIISMTYTMQSIFYAVTDKSEVKEEQNSALRLENFFCNITVSALLMRVVTMFQPVIGDKMLWLTLGLGVGQTLGAQIAIFGILSSIGVSAFLTPTFVERDTESTTTVAETSPSYAKSSELRKSQETLTKDKDGNIERSFKNAVRQGIRSISSLFTPITSVFGIGR